MGLFKYACARFYSKFGKSQIPSVSPTVPARDRWGNLINEEAPTVGMLIDHFVKSPNNPHLPPLTMGGALH